MGEVRHENALVALACQGDERAFAELVHMRQGQVRGLMRRWCGDPALADDLAQEVFIQAWQKLGQLQSRAAFGGWLRQIAVNVWLQYARKARLAMDELEAANDVAAQGAGPGVGERIDLEKALATLRPPERLCVVLSFGEGMTHGEIAEATSLPLGTVKSHISRATAKLRSLLQADKVMP